MRIGVYVLVFMLCISCDYFTPQTPPKSPQQSQTENSVVSQTNQQNTSQIAPEKDWIKPGICETPNQVKSHGMMNCIVVDWQCPRCKKNINDLRWDICQSCCQELGVCIVCLKKNTP